MQLSLFAPLEKRAPTLALSNIEYLCLKIHAHPGRPARWYLRELHRYRFGTPGTGSWNAIYFSPCGRYRGKLFIDDAPKTRPARGTLTRSCSRRGAIRLLPAGVEKAKTAAAKIGLDL
jgi:hypothetical protein